MSRTPLQIGFEEGTLLLRSVEDAGVLAGLPECRADPRAGGYRLPACHYRQLLLHLRTLGTPYDDGARAYHELSLAERSPRMPLVHQTEGLEAWWAAGGTGVVVLPTGSGKTYLGLLAIMRTGRSALVVTPTLELVAQWAEVMAETFGQPVGVVGGGSHIIEDLTVTTYASAYRKMERFGNRFGMLEPKEARAAGDDDDPAGEVEGVPHGGRAPFRRG